MAGERPVLVVSVGRGYIRVPAGVTVFVATTRGYRVVRGPAEARVDGVLVYVRAVSLTGEPVVLRIGVWRGIGVEAGWANPLLLPLALQYAQMAGSLLQHTV